MTMEWVVLSITYGGTVSVVRGFGSKIAAEEAECRIVHERSLEEQAESESQHRAWLDKWRAEHPGQCYSYMSNPPADGEIKQAFVFADPKD